MSEQRTNKAWIIAAVAIGVGLVGLVVVVVIGLAALFWVSQPTTVLTEEALMRDVAAQAMRAHLEREVSQAEIDSAAEQIVRAMRAEDASVVPLEFDSAEARETVMRSLLGKARWEALAKFPDSVPAMSFASPSPEAGVNQLALAAATADSDPEAVVSVDTIYTYDVKSPETGTLALLIQGGIVTMAEYRATGAAEATQYRMDGE